VAALREWKEAIERDGYAIIPRAVERDVCDRLVQCLAEIDCGPNVLRRGGIVFGMRNILTHLTEVRRLADSDAIRELVVPILGARAFPVRGLLFEKTPQANWNVPWHRDLTIAVRCRRDVPGFGPWTVKAGIQHVQPPLSVLERMLTVRIHLDDSAEQNGPLVVLPGSHLRAECASRESLYRRDDVSAVICSVQRGDVLLMRPLLLHASSSAREPAHRRVVHLEFAADPLPGGLEWFEACA
jgi:hypothetical protein